MGGVRSCHTGCVMQERSVQGHRREERGLSGHPREWTWSSFLFSNALGSRHEHSSRMSHDMGKGITWEKKKRGVSMGTHSWVDGYFKIRQTGSERGQGRSRFCSIWCCSFPALVFDMMIIQRTRAWLGLPRLPLCQMCPKHTHARARSPASLFSWSTRTRRFQISNRFVNMGGWFSLGRPVRGRITQRTKCTWTQQQTP